MVEDVPSTGQVLVKSRSDVRDLHSVRSGASTRRVSPLVHAKDCLCGKRIGAEPDQGAICSRFTAADYMGSLTYQVFQEEFQG